MGQERKQAKLDVQKVKLKRLFCSIIDTNINVMDFQLTLTDKAEEIKGLKHFIKESKKAKEIINSIVHYEILTSLYNSFLNGKESYFLSLVRTVNRKDTIVKWDRTKKGFKEFQQKEIEARAKSEQEIKDKMAMQEMIRKAKEEGKKVEFALVDGKLQPTIVEDKAN